MTSPIFSIPGMSYVREGAPWVFPQMLNSFQEVADWWEGHRKEMPLIVGWAALYLAHPKEGLAFQQQKARLRHYKRVIPGLSEEKLRKALIEACGGRPYKKGGRWVAPLQGRFSYGDTDYNASSDYYLLKCPECGIEDAEVDEGLSSKFEPVGAYAKCSACGTYHRRSTQCATFGELIDAGLHHYVDNDDFDGWEDFENYLGELLADAEEHCKSYNLPDFKALYAEGRNLDWRNRSGYKVFKDLDAREVAKAFTVNSDFHIYGGKLILHEGGNFSLSASVAHHDATSYISLSPLWEYCEEPDDDDDCEGYLPFEGLEEASKAAYIAEHILCGKEDIFEFSKACQFKRLKPSWVAEKLDDLISRIAPYEEGCPIPGNLQQAAQWAVVEALTKMGDHLRNGELEFSHYHLECLRASMLLAFQDE